MKKPAAAGAGRAQLFDCAWIMRRDVPSRQEQKQNIKPLTPNPPWRAPPLAFDGGLAVLCLQDMAAANWASLADRPATRCLDRFDRKSGRPLALARPERKLADVYDRQIPLH